MEKILNISNLSKTYSNEHETTSVLKNLNLEVCKGEIISIKGPSGSGKTTLLNILGTLDQEYQGSVVIKNDNIKDIIDPSIFRSRSIGFVFQFHNLLSDFTIYENITMPLFISGNDLKINKDYVNELISILNLNNKLKAFPAELSGGEKQRVALIRALVNKPSIILADEPTGNLDDKNTEIILNLIYELRKKYNQTFIIATHDYKVDNISDRILKINNGNFAI